MPRILAIDYGQKRTGIAVTDELQIIASGLTTIPSATTIDFLKDYFAKEKVEAVYPTKFKEKYGSDSIVFKNNILKINDEIIKPTKKLTLDTLNEFLSIYYGTLLYFEIK